MENCNRNEIDKESSNFLFPLEDTNMLNKLRSCSIIPKGFSEFQIFVRTLTGDTISNDIIKEAWRHIYENESPEKLDCLVPATERSSTSSDILSTLRNDDDDDDLSSDGSSQSSKKNTKKSYSSQNILSSQQKQVRKNKIVSVSGSHVEMFTSLSSKQDGQSLPATVQNDVHSSASQSIPKRDKKSPCSSTRTTNQTKVSYSENKINKSNFHFTDSDSNSSNLVHEQTFKNDYDSNVSLPQGVELTAKKKLKRVLSSNVASSSKKVQEKEVCLKKNKIDDVISDDVKVEEDSSSDCEVIEIVSLNKPNKASDGSESEPNTSVSECEEVDSDSSVEILKAQCNIKKTITNTDDTDCPIHGGNGLQASSNSCRSNNGKKSNFIGIDKQVPLSPQVCPQSSDKEETKKFKKKKKKDVKYKLLRSEVKCLKSLLVNLLTSLKNNSRNDNCKHPEDIPFLLKTDLMDRLQECSGENKKSSGSVFEGRRKKSEEHESKAGSSQNLKSHVFVEGDGSTRRDKPHRKKQRNSKNTKNNSDNPEPLQNVDTDFKSNDNGRRQKFVWRDIIKDTLKSRPTRQMPVEKLKRIVIAKYYLCRGNVSQNTTVKFFRYLHSTSGVVVDGDMAIYSDKPFIKLSSMSEQKKQFVLKTVTTTKEYKMS